MKKNLALVGIAILSASCSWSNSQIKPFAPIKKLTSYQEGEGGSEEIRNSILEGCPLGSPREEVVEYIRRNFWTWHSGMNPNDDIYFRIHEKGTYPVGSYWVEVGFKFDDSDKLKDVFIEHDGCSL